MSMPNKLRSLWLLGVGVSVFAGCQSTEPVAALEEDPAFTPADDPAPPPTVTLYPGPDESSATCSVEDLWPLADDFCPDAEDGTHSFPWTVGASVTVGGVTCGSTYNNTTVTVQCVNQVA